MKKRKKSLATDFDETLFFRNLPEGFKKEDVKKIKEFQEKGHLFGVCTGRPTIGVKDKTKGLFDFDFYIVTSGALILDRNFHVIEKHCLQYDFVEKLYNKYKNECLFFVQANQLTYTFKRDENLPIEQNIITHIDEVKDYDIYGISLNLFSQEKALKVYQDIVDTYSHIQPFLNKECIDIVHKDCSKGKGILTLKKYKNIDLMCSIGDAHNDIPMLEDADLSFTFHRSDESVQQKATRVVDSIAEAIDVIEKE